MTFIASDWAALILSPDFMGQIDKLAHNRFSQDSLAEEAVTYALEALSHDNWSKLKDFNGNSKPSTYAFSITSRLLEDFSRKRFGRPRPPSWLQELGQGWVSLWRMLCLERQWPEVIKNKLRFDYKPEVLDERIFEIKRRLPNCGAAGFSECCVSELGLDNGTNPDEFIQDSYINMDKEIQRHIKESVLHSLGNILDKCDTNTSNSPSQVYEAIIKSLRLSEDERLLLTLSYEDGLSSRKIAELLNQSPSHIQRQLKQIRQNLHNALLEQGIDASIFNQEVEHA